LNFLKSLPADALPARSTHAGLTTKGQPVTVQAIYGAESEHTGETRHPDMILCDRETVSKRSERENSVTHFEMVVQRQVKKSVQSASKCTVG
jgi:hypothetical protein